MCRFEGIIGKGGRRGRRGGVSRMETKGEYRVRESGEYWGRQE